MVGESGVFCDIHARHALLNRIWFPSNSKHYCIEESVMEDPSFTITLVHQIPPEVLNVFYVNKVLEIFKQIDFK